MRTAFSASHPRTASAVPQQLPQLEPAPILDASHASRVLRKRPPDARTHTRSAVRALFSIFFSQVEKELRHLRQTPRTRASTGIHHASAFSESEAVTEALPRQNADHHILRLPA